MNETTTLVMTFVCEDGMKYSISLDNPRADITPEEVKTAMGQIITANALAGSKGLYDLTEAHSAQIVVRTVNGLNIN